jgi:hypothetical protein
MRETPHTATRYSSAKARAVKIRRTRGQSAGKAPTLKKTETGEPSETTRSVPAQRLEAQWVVGFVDGEGCFYIGINPNPTMTVGYQVLPEFTVVQHERDVQLLYALKRFFDCGVVRTNHAGRMAYRVRDAKHLRERVIPFFEKHSLKSKKKLDFLNFRKVLLMMDKGEHLRPDGLEQIRAIASKMNTARERYSPAPPETG